MELTGRTPHGLPMTCVVKEVLYARFVHGPNIRVIGTDQGEFRLAPGIKLDDFEVGQTYFLQTINLGAFNRPIQVVDFIKT